MILRRYGLGANLVVDSSGNTVDCSNWWTWLSNFACGAASAGINVAPTLVAASSPGAPATAAPPDCSSFWNIATNSQCTGGVPLVILAGGVVALILLTRR